MSIDFSRGRTFLKKYDFESLFISELGWDHNDHKLNVTIDDLSFTLSALAHKRGMVAFVCESDQHDVFPGYQQRKKIETRVAKSVREHIIIFVDTQRTTQVWQWVKREPGKPAACREHQYYKGQHGDPLLQKLHAITFSLQEEESLTLVDVTGRVRAAFDVEKVTKKFYDLFREHHKAFLEFINGIPDETMERWYASVMLNRLMFIYFIQKKGFLDGDMDYLRNKLDMFKIKAGDTYYKDFLCPLFFEGFAKKEADRSPEINETLGKIPYLDGGIFQRHQVEEIYNNEIQIEDEAFDTLFGFFEQYKWHLDERPLRNDREINPDVLGYIFEKYINQKQMGAYYTKEDITGYISKNTVIPFIFDKAKEGCKIAFEGENSIWSLLQREPDKYIYDAVKHGITVNVHAQQPEKLDEPYELPEEIAAGLDTEAPGLLERRKGWNRPAPPEFALPTEIWREVVARRQRYDELIERMSSGQVNSINDLITYNLDITQFAQDVIENSEGTELVKAFFKAIQNVTVLDPTCGSGAFLFAALNILEPLYEACLDRMQVFVDELERSGEKHRPEKYKGFKDILKKIERHPNRKYFIYKSIIVNNLYGVDIMEEAIEICKLRLFLKLVAQVDDVNKIEPLPDIDFNVKAGNTLVGFASYEEVKEVVESKLDFGGSMDKIKEKAEDIESVFQLFQEMQTEHYMDAEFYSDTKRELKSRLKDLEDELNQYLAGEYGIEMDDPDKYKSWLSSYKPFHWFVDFYKIMKNGGFDVIIGNPPYVEYAKIKKKYTINEYITSECGNLYAFVFEKSLIILKRDGYCSFIIQISGISTERMSTLQGLLKRYFYLQYLSHYSGDRNPAELFSGVKNRLTIVVGKNNSAKENLIHSTNYLKWYTNARTTLFSQLLYVDINKYNKTTTMTKIGNNISKKILEKIYSNHHSISNYFSKSKSKFIVIYHNTPIHWVRAFTFRPYFWNEREGEKLSSQMILKYLENKTMQNIITATLNSSIFYWYWLIHSDCYHLILREIYNFKIDIENISNENKKLLTDICDDLMEDFIKNSIEKRARYKTTGLVKYQEIDPKKSKMIIDKIDNILGKHYNLTDQELDYIINYDIKFRMAKELNK